MLRFALTTVLALAMTATIAHASVMETASSRYNRALVGLDNDSDGPHQTNGPSIYGLFDNTTNASASDFSGDASGSASQTSTIDPASYSADLDAIASITYDGFGFGSTVAESDFVVAFTVTAPVDFSINGTASASGGGNLASVRLVRIGGVGTPTQTFASLSGTNSTIIDVDGSLLPGNYELRSHAEAGADFVFESGTYSGTASTSFTMTLTPEPSSLVLLTLGGIALIRRRHQGTL
ncbi:MAG: PEP-CTERM sorting domain-containing protein [Phycisphaerales bacterium]|nr:PEP-CTERM sorting domain-containing protein [Phycisphaerales bacterium]MCB9862766.1 PEP-CTERM sorting domain-containing protein [Phycisphaerales bacterium]